MADMQASTFSPCSAGPCASATSLLQSIQGSALDVLDIEQLQALKATISTCLTLVHRSLNGRQPINSLHPELLGEILQLSLPSSSGYLCEGNSDQAAALKAQRQTLTTYMKVCGQWRSVVLQMAAFWTVVDMSSDAAWCAACLERSKEAPLSVFLQYPLNEAQYLPLAAHGYRIRELFLDIPREQRAAFPTELPTLLPVAPNLESLSIVTRCYIWDSDRPELHLERRPQIFPEPPCSLTKLLLKGPCWIPGGIPYHQLTHLYISQGMPFDLLLFFAFLRQCRSLENLVLDDISNKGIEKLSDDCIPMLELPTLRLLTLGVNQGTWAASYLLNYVILPPSVTLRIIGVFAIDVLKDKRLHLPFTDTFDTLILECTSVYTAIQAAGPSSGILIHSVGMRYHWANVRETGETLRNVLSRVLPCRNIKRVTIDSSAWDVTMQILPDTLLPTTLRLVDRHIQPRNGGQQEHLPDMPESGLRRFLELADLQVWSTNVPLGRPLSSVPGSLKKYTLYYVHPADSEALDPERCVMDSNGSPSISGVDFSFVDNASWPKLDLPGVRPPCHLYDWQ